MKISSKGFRVGRFLERIDEPDKNWKFSAALCERFSSRGEGDFADKVLSAIRYQFGGHGEKAAANKGGA
jgi:6-phosphogluconate dehydrogenase